ncbi:hypothetical protein [Halomicrobium urmianum]|uniref:hypothetical protein n=1 Tax=Halomicrobium urmianum TaxID=1586233 RepID=UPI001CD97291|nr:hypothetical protein [Halomicrobium urmianum]
MADAERALDRLARVAAVLAGLVGGYHVLSLLGAFGPVSCSTSVASSGAESANGTVTTTTTTVTRECESGIDALLGAGSGGNASVLFSWSLVLLVLVAAGSYGAWAGHRFVTWAAVVVGAVVTVVGAFSIGWYFLLPTVFLTVAATARSVAARRA